MNMFKGMELGILVCIIFAYVFGEMDPFTKFIIREKGVNEEKHLKANGMEYSGVPNKSVRFSRQVLDDFRNNVGCLKAETGGMLASTRDENVIDRCYFDNNSQNTSGSFYYDIESMSKVFREWKSKGYITNGIFHSHPKGAIRPSYHDISSALLHIDFFSLEYFYLPIFQPNRKGNYTMFFYVVRKKEDDLVVNLDYVLKATENGYKFAPFQAWTMSYAIDQLKAYREEIEGRSNSEMDEVNKKNKTRGNYTGDAIVQRGQKGFSTSQLFEKVSSLYPKNVLDKVIVCVGTGGARSYLENCARSGFKNYVLIDADVVSPSNIATQGVFISEIGKKKVEVIRDKILDINSNATVICVDKFLDEEMSDEEFKGFMDLFPDKKPTDYLILGCTDNFEAQKRSAILALKFGNPYIAAMMYEGGAAAEIIFTYPGVTESCPRCLLRDRFEKYENGYINDVDSSGCPIFATERMNALKGYITLMLLMYHEDPENPLSKMLDDVKERNFIEIRLTPYLKDTNLGIHLFDKVFDSASKYVFFDETIWVPQHPDCPEFGSEPCKLCGGTGDLKILQSKWAQIDTRDICCGDVPWN